MYQPPSKAYTGAVQLCENSNDSSTIQPCWMGSSHPSAPRKVMKVQIKFTSAKTGAKLE